MPKEIYRYEFSKTVSMPDVEEALLLAAIAAESLHGRAKVNLDASFRLDSEKRACVVDSSNPVGRDIARLFTGFLTCEFGEKAFRVERLDRGTKSPSSAGTEEIVG